MTKPETDAELASAPCPCGRKLTYAACCEPLHRGTVAADAEALMRSRYSAYVFGLEEYLLETWHPATRPQQLDLHSDTSHGKWLGLDVKRHVRTGPDHAIVEFVARYRSCNGRAQRMHEISCFVRENERWYYLAAENESK